MVPASTHFFGMPELVLHLLLYLDPTSISRLMQTNRCLKDISTPALYYHVKIEFEPTKPKHNIFTSTESILELARNVDHIRYLELGALEITYYVNCVFAHQQQQQEEEEGEEGLLPTVPTLSANTTETITKHTQGKERRPLWLAPPDPHTCTVHPIPLITHLTKLEVRIFYCAPYKGCPYRLPKFCDPKATLTYICWIMDCNPHLQDVGLYEVLVNDQRDIRLLTTSIFGLKHLQRGVLELNHRDWEESAQSFRWAPIFFGCCPPSVLCFQLELLGSDMYWNWPFDRRQAGLTKEPIWQKSDQDCGLLPITTMAANLPLRGQEPLTNLMKLMFLDLNEEIVLEEEFRSMLGQCPNLKHLTMPTVEPIRNPRGLAREIARLCPRLTFINTTHGVGGIGIWETMVWLLEMLPEQLVQGFDCGADESFEISGLSKNTDVRSLFWRHSTTLQTIHLGGCRNIDSKAIQAILIGCGGVESLTVHWLLRRDTHQELCLYLEDAIEVPWACASRLQVLMLTVAIPDQPLRHLTQGQDFFYERPSPLTLSEEETRQFELLEALYRQIGAMSELRTLDLRAIYYDPQGNRPSSANYLFNSFPALLHLSDAAHTETGRPGYLNHLGGLTKLEKLMGSMSLTKETTGVFGTTTEEVEWMARHWPRLERAQFFPPGQVISGPFLWWVETVAKQASGGQGGRRGRRELVCNATPTFYY